jgi:hypothetical protein
MYWYIFIEMYWYTFDPLCVIRELLAELASYQQESGIGSYQHCRRHDPPLDGFHDLGLAFGGGEEDEDDYGDGSREIDEDEGTTMTTTTTVAKGGTMPKEDETGDGVGTTERLVGSPPARWRPILFMR